MADRAHVRSTEDLQALRLALVRFVERARPAVDEVESEIHKLRDWLEGERLQHWRVQIRRREAILEDARQHLRAMQSRGPCRSEVRQVRIAEEKVEEAQRKMAAVRSWITRLDGDARDPLMRCRQLSTMLDVDLPAGERQLGQLLGHLEAYAEHSSPKPKRSAVARAGGSIADSADLENVDREH